MSESAAPLSVALVITGALLMAAKGIIAKLLYHSGVTLEALLVLRAVMALPLIWGWAWWRGELPRVWQAPKATLAIAMLGGLSGYYLGTWCDFRGLELIDASLERVLLFTYPAIVVLVRALWRRRAPSAREATAVVLTWVGVVLAVGGFDLALWRANGHGALLVLASAALFSGYLFANEHVGKRIGSVGFMVVAATSAALALSLHFAIVSTPAAVSGLSGQLLLALLAMTAFTNVLPLFMISASIARIGAARAAIISAVGPPATLVLAWWWLGEAMGPVQLAGALCCVGGVLALEVGRARGKSLA